MAVKGPEDRDRPIWIHRQVYLRQGAQTERRLNMDTTVVPSSSLTDALAESVTIRDDALHFVSIMLAT